MSRTDPLPLWEPVALRASRLLATGGVLLALAAMALLVSALEVGRARRLRGRTMPPSPPAPRTE